MNRILRSQLPSNPWDLAVFDTTTGSSPGRSRGSSLFQRGLTLLTVVLFSVVGLLSTAQVSLPYNEAFTGIAAANGFPTVTGGAWTRTATTAIQPTYITNQASYNRVGRGDTKFMSFRYNAGTSTYAVGPFALTAGSTYQVGNWYITDGLGGWTTFKLTYGTGTTVALQSNTIATASGATNTTYSNLQGTFSPATSGNYYIAMTMTSTSAPWYFSVDDFSVTMLPPCTGTPNAPVATLSGAASVCAGVTKTMSATGFSTASALSTQWQMSSTSGGPYTNVSGGVGATAASYTTAVLGAGTYYYVCTSTCTSSGLVATSNQIQVTVNALPTVAISAPNGGAFCGTQQLTGTGASTYAWTPALSLSSATGTSVYFTGTSGVTVNVTGTDANGCTGTAAQAVTYTAPSAITMSSTVPNFCGTGGTATISASSSAPYTYVFSALDGAVLTNPTANSIDATVTGTSAIRVTGSDAGTGCAAQATYSVGLYPLPSATVTTTASGVCPGTPATINSGLSAGNFSAVCIPVAALAIPVTATYLANNGTMSVALSSGSADDGGWGNIPIGFNFNFFGTSYNTLNAGTNGVLQFGAYNATALGDYTIGALPNTVDPLGAIYICANDLNCGTAGTPNTYVRYWTEGYAPNRKFVIEYRVYQYGSTTNIVNVQAIVYETLGMVDIVAKQVASTNSKSIGVNSPTGTVGATAPNCAATPNTASYWSGQTATISAAAPQAWRFSPPANYLTVWSATDVNGTTSLTTNVNGSTINTINGFSATVAPLLTTQYSISYANATTGCSNALTPAQVTMLVLGTVAPQGISATSTVATVCPGASIPLATSYTGSLDGLTFQWQVSTDGGASWNPIAGATSATYTATQAVASSFRVGMTSCAGAITYSAPVAIALNGFVDCYCVVTVVTTADEEITNVTLGSLNNSSTCATVAPGPGSLASQYSNYTSGAGAPTPLAMIQSASVAGSITVGSCGTFNYTSGAAIFIDYNQNGVFTDAGELVWNNGASSNINCVPATTLPVSFTVPGTATPGLTRMRVISAEGTPGSSINPCGTYYYGEVEDYLVQILGPCDPALFTPPLASADDPDATVCGTQTSQLTAFDFNGSASPIYMWYDAPTGGTLLQNSTSNFYTPAAITATTTWYVATNTGTCITDRFPVTLNWVSAPSITLTNSNPSSCGTTSTATDLAATSSNAGYAYTWNSTPVAGSGITAGTTGASLSTVTPTINGVYVYTANAVDATSGCTTSATTTVGFYSPLTGTATVTQPLVCGGNGSVNFSVTGSGTVFASDFTSATLNPAQAQLCSNAVIVGGQLQFTAPVNNQKGGILITNTTGIASNDFQIDFDMITTAGTTPPADGFSYSYGPDVVCMPTPVGTAADNIIVGAGAANPENGSGSGIRLSFDAYTNGVNVNGIYLMYNCLRMNPSSTLTPAEGLYYFNANTSWIGGATTHVTISINALGQMSMWLAGVQVLNNAALPAGYLTADKSTWKHAFAARTGGLNQGHLIDNLDIHYNNFYEYSADNGTTWTSASPVSVPAPSSVHSLARYTTQPACSVDLGTASILYQVAAPTGVTGGSTCLNGSTLNVSAFGLPNGGQTASYSFGNNLSSGIGTAFGGVGVAPSIQGSSVTVSLPAGAIVTSANLVLTNVTSGYMGELQVALSGGYTLGTTQVFPTYPASGSSATISLTPSSIGTSAINVLLGESYDDPGTDATAANISLVIIYSLPSAPSWFNNSVASAGSFVGTGSPFNVVGTAILPSTAASTSSTAYAANVVTNGASTCYSSTVPATVTVGQPLTVAVAATAPVSLTTTLNASQLSMNDGTSAVVTGSVIIPVGATILSTQLVINGVTSVGTWGTDGTGINISMSGASTVASQALTTSFAILNGSGPFTFTASPITSGGGTVFVNIANNGGWGDVITVDQVQLIVTYNAPVTGSVCPGTPVTLTAVTTGGGANPVYQWNLNGSPISGAAAATYVASPTAATDAFTVSVTDDCNAVAVTSASYSQALFTVTPGAITGPAAILVNDFTAPILGAGTWTIAGQNAGSSIQWVYGTAPVAPFTTIAGATSDSQTLYATGGGGTIYLTATTTTLDGCTIQANVVTVVLGNAIDTPCTARPVTVGDQTGLSFSTAAAGVDAGEVFAPALGCDVQNGWCTSSLQGSVWFSFVAPASGHISVLAPGWDNQLAIYSATNCANYATFTLINANDDGGGAQGGATFSAFLSDVKCLTPGTTYYIQLDGYSGVGTSTLVITDLGNTAPVISALSANITASAVTGTCAATVSWSQPVATDDQSCVTMTSNIASGTSFNVGATTVTYTATDAQGLVTTASFTVTVNDTQLPTITAPAAVTVTAALNSCTATATLGSATTADNCGVATTTNNAPATFPIGNTTVTYTVTDVNGNVATATQVVTVNIDPTNLWYVDTDGDGFGAGASLLACSQPAGYVTNNTDCNNAVATTYPGAPELCNGVDDNCNTLADDGLTFLDYYADTDADGYGSGAATNACAQPTGFVLNNTDCAPTNANINPGHFEICGNASDDNCNGQIDEGCLLPGENPSNATSITPSVWPSCTATNGTLVGASISGGAQTICLSGEDKWHQFVATSEGLSIVVSSTSADILIELQTAAGALVAQENAVAGLGGETLNHYGLTAGQVYRVGVRNYNSALGTGTYTICVKMLKRGGCDYGPGPYTLCQYFKATWAGATGTSYTFTYTGLTGPAAGNVYTRTQTSDICVLSSVLPTLPYGSTYNVLITNTYSINNAAGVAETISVPALAPCSMTISTEPTTALRTTDQCAAGPRFRGAIVASLPWVCGATNWRWEFTELDASGNPVGLPISVNRGAASNYINLGTVLQLQYGKTYSVRTAPILPYTGTNYQWGASVCMSIVGTAGMVADGSQANQQVVRTETANDVNMSLYPNPTHGTDVNINLSGVTSENVQIRVVDAMGRQVWSNRYSVSGVLNTNITFERPLASGLYFVEALFNGEVQTQRLMVQK